MGRLDPGSSGVPVMGITWRPLGTVQVPDARPSGITASPRGIDQVPGTTEDPVGDR
jgi:hypothetical protein